MTKIEIISGFLGAGKTTLINRLIREAYPNERIVLIENEFGEIGVDGGFLQEAGVQIQEMNSGCICCSLVGDFSKALKKVVAEYYPDRVIIEPSGVGKLSDVVRAVTTSGLHDAVLNSSVVVVDVNKCKMYMKNFGEFFNDQIENAGCILFSHTDKTTGQKLDEALSLVREKNPTATIVTTSAGLLNVQTLVEAMEHGTSLEKELEELKEKETCPVCGHHHHDHEHHHAHEHEHHHDHDHEHHHHDHHDHEHHHHHHADEVFTSWGRETVRSYSVDGIHKILSALEDTDQYGMILRAKGYVRGEKDQWIYFDYIPGEPDVRLGNPAAIGRYCVIGSHIREEALELLFNGGAIE